MASRLRRYAACCSKPGPRPCLSLCGASPLAASRLASRPACDDEHRHDLFGDRVGRSQEVDPLATCGRSKPDSREAPEQREERSPDEMRSVDKKTARACLPALPASVGRVRFLQTIPVPGGRPWRAARPPCVAPHAAGALQEPSHLGRRTLDPGASLSLLRRMAGRGRRIFPKMDCRQVAHAVGFAGNGNVLPKRTSFGRCIPTWASCLRWHCIVLSLAPARRATCPWANHWHAGAERREVTTVRLSPLLDRGALRARSNLIR